MIDVDFTHIGRCFSPFVVGACNYSVYNLARNKYNLDVWLVFIYLRILILVGDSFLSSL